MLALEAIESGLSQCTGTEDYWKNDALCFRYTDGVRFMWESCEAYWLLIAISSYRRNEPFQVWELKRNTENSGAVLTMKEDTNEPELVKQKIPLTNFPLQEIKFFLIDGILLLTSEY
jgi:hypothetical protein